MATPLRAHFFPGLLHDMTVVALVAGSVLPAERISPTLVVPVVQREVWPAPTLTAVPSFSEVNTSKARSPEALATVTDGAVLSPVALVLVPSGVVWSTPVNVETDT